MEKIEGWKRRNFPSTTTENGDEKLRSAGTSAPVAVDLLPGDGFASGGTGGIVRETILVRMRL